MTSDNGFVDSGSSPPALSNSTAPALTPTIQPSVDVLTELKAAWHDYQDADRRGLAFGKRLYELRKQFSAQGNHSGEGFLPLLQQASIPQRTAYYWIHSFEESIGERKFKPKEKWVKASTPADQPTATLPFEYEEDFLTPEELAEFENVCKTLPWKPSPNERSGFDLDAEGNKVWRAFRRNMQLMWCDVRNTHAEKDRQNLCGPIATAPAIVQTIVKKLAARVGRHVNYVSLMCYASGTDHLSWHQHSEDRGHDTPVMIVPCGQERKFSYRVKESNEKNGIVTKNGSLVILPSSFNDTHEHAILDDKTATGTRYAINAKCMDEIYYGETASPAVESAVEDNPEPTVHKYPVEDYSYHPELQATTNSRSHGMGLKRLRDIADNCGVSCNIAFEDNQFVITMTTRFDKESDARQFLEDL